MKNRTRQPYAAMLHSLDLRQLHKRPSVIIEIHYFNTESSFVMRNAKFTIFNAKFSFVVVHTKIHHFEYKILTPGDYCASHQIHTLLWRHTCSRHHC